MKPVAIGCGLIVLATFGCGGSGPAGSCGQVEPCGGDVVGTWTATSGCVNATYAMMSFESGLAGACPTATLSATKISVSGSMSLNSDLTYSSTGTETVSFSVNLPSSCTQGQCAALGAYLQSSLGAGSSASCTGTSSCACSLTEQVNDDDSGTYTTTGSTLTTTSATTGTSAQSYCVKDDTLHLVAVDTTMNMGPMGQATIDEDTTFTRQ
jgi:hypothetical protein